MDKRYKRLVGNSIIFAIGNFGSKLMQFIMIPIYSYALSTYEFGKVDLLTNIVYLLAPIVSFDLFDGAFRFALDKFEDKRYLDGFLSDNTPVGLLANKGYNDIIVIRLSNDAAGDKSLQKYVDLNLIMFIIGSICSIFVTGYPIMYTVILLIITIFFSLVSNFARAIGFVKHFAIAGIINTFTMGVANIILLLVVKLGIEGYLVSFCVGQFIGILYLFIATDIPNYLSVREYSLETLKKLLKYSIPLIPNGLAWWLNSTSDRVFVLGILGPSYNGIYAMASKIPSAISTILSVFFQSWQISVVEEYDKKDSMKFINTVYDTLSSLLFCAAVLLVAVIKPVFNLILSANYYNGWKLIPILLLSVIYTNIASFLGTMYTANKKTVGILTTTVYGAIINVILTVVFLNMIGLNGAAVANAVSFFVVSLLRYKYMKKLGKIRINFRKAIYLHVMFIVSCLSVYILKSNITIFMVGILLIVAQIILDSNLKLLLKGVIMRCTK